MFSTGGQVVKKRETLREREDRRKELSKLMEKWQCTIGFEFHVQMNTTHKMFSSKQISSINTNPYPSMCSIFEYQLWGAQYSRQLRWLGSARHASRPERRVPRSRYQGLTGFGRPHPATDQIRSQALCVRWFALGLSDHSEALSYHAWWPSFLLRLQGEWEPYSDSAHSDGVRHRKVYL